MKREREYKTWYFLCLQINNLNVHVHLIHYAYVSLILFLNVWIISSWIHVSTQSLRLFLFFSSSSSGAWRNCFHPHQSHVSMLDLNPFTAWAGGKHKKLTWKYTYILIDAGKVWYRWNQGQNVTAKARKISHGKLWLSSGVLHFWKEFYMLSAADLTSQIWMWDY